MEIIRRAEIVSLTRPGVTSEQLLFPENSRSTRVTITRVTVTPGGSQPRHAHAQSEQIWVAIRGAARLLLAGSAVESLGEGDIVRFAEGDVHGVENAGPEIFVYLAVTSPPINFRSAYAHR